MNVNYLSKRRGFLAGAATCWAWMAQSSVRGAEDRSQIQHALTETSLLRNGERDNQQFGNRPKLQVVRSQPAISIVQSDIGAAVDVGAENATKPVAKLIKVPQHELNTAHGSAVSMSLIIEPCGAWQLKMRPVHNSTTAMSDEKHRSFERQFGSEVFRLNIRLLSSERALEDTHRLGAQNQIQVSLDDFWVQLNVHKPITRRGWDPKISRYFQQVNQAEFEFSVHSDSSRLLA